MRRHWLGRTLLVTSLAAIVAIVPAAAAGAASAAAPAAKGAASAAPAPRDPWTRVPALTTGCYREVDGYAAKLAAAEEVLERDLRRQEAVNAKLSKEVQSTDMMELARRQQQYMMDHPQEAMALMQRNQALGEGDAPQRMNATAQALAQELADLDARYAAALQARIGPIEADFADLDVRAQKDLVAVGEMWDYAPWAIAEWNALVQQENAAYEKVCAEWWATSGLYHGWLQRFRQHLVETVRLGEEAEHVGAGFMVQVVGTPEEKFVPVSGLRAVNQYMDTVDRVFGKRRSEPRKPRDGMATLPPKPKK